MNEITKRVLGVANESTRRRNPGVFGVGGLHADKPEQEQRRTLEQAKQEAKACGRRVPKGVGAIIRVHLIRVGGRPLDEDNCIAGYKPLRDAIAARLGLDDADSGIDWEYSQVRTRGRRGTIVKMEMIA